MCKQDSACICPWHQPFAAHDGPRAGTKLQQGSLQTSHYSSDQLEGYPRGSGKLQEAVLADALGLHAAGAVGTMWRVLRVLMAVHILTNTAVMSRERVLDVCEP